MKKLRPAWLEMSIFRKASFWNFAGINWQRGKCRSEFLFSIQSRRTSAEKSAGGSWPGDLRCSHGALSPPYSAARLQKFFVICREAGIATQLSGKETADPPEL